MNNQYIRPETKKLSILIATILLVYALARFISIPETEYTLQFWGLYLPISLNIRLAINLIVIGLSISGSYWFFGDHPLARKQKIYDHLLLPALSAWVIGFPIMQLPFSPIWLLSYIIGGFIFTLVIYAEFITIDPDDVRLSVAVIILTAVSFAIYLILIIVLRYQAMRLIINIPTIFIGSYMVSFRVTQIHAYKSRPHLEAATVALITCEMCAALHYWPFSHLAFGIAVLATTYSSNLLIINKIRDEKFPILMVEPLLSFIGLWILAFWFR